MLINLDSTGTTPRGFTNSDDHPTGRRTIVAYYLSIAEWSDAQLEGASL